MITPAYDSARDAFSAGPRVALAAREPGVAPDEKAGSLDVAYALMRPAKDPGFMAILRGADTPEELWQRAQRTHYAACGGSPCSARAITRTEARYWARWTKGSPS